MVINGAFSAIFHTDGSLQMMNGAWCTAAGKWQDASSRELKENIQSLTVEEAEEALEGLQPVRFNYKTDKEDESLGFIAEDVPELVASKDRKSMSSMDVVAVLTKVLQEQQKAIDDLQKQIEDLKKESK
jgi:predicted S18 family serine protease